MPTDRGRDRGEPEPWQGARKKGGRGDTAQEGRPGSSLPPEAHRVYNWTCSEPHLVLTYFSNVPWAPCSLLSDDNKLVPRLKSRAAISSRKYEAISSRAAALLCVEGGS